MKNPSLLLFDLGGVLIESTVFSHIQRLLPAHIEQQELKERWLFSPAVRQFECGEISANEFARQFVEEWDLSLSPKTFLEDFASWPRNFFPGAYETIQELRQFYRVGCLSNSNSVHWQRFEAIDEAFDVTLFSHLLGAIKPEPEIFVKALDTCAVDPDRVVFFDDCQANVDTARQMGMHAFVTDGFESLKEILAMTAIM